MEPPGITQQTWLHTWGNSNATEEGKCEPNTLQRHVHIVHHLHHHRLHQEHRLANTGRRPYTAPKHCDLLNRHRLLIRNEKTIHARHVFRNPSARRLDVIVAPVAGHGQTPPATARGQTKLDTTQCGQGRRTTENKKHIQKHDSEHVNTRHTLRIKGSKPNATLPRVKQLNLNSGQITSKINTPTKNNYLTYDHAVTLRDQHAHNHRKQHSPTVRLRDDLTTPPSTGLQPIEDTYNITSTDGSTKIRRKLQE